MASDNQTNWKFLLKSKSIVTQVWHKKREPPTVGSFRCLIEIEDGCQFSNIG
jgi:hypothetical protein